MKYSVTIQGDTLAEIATYARDLSDRLRRGVVGDILGSETPRVYTESDAGESSNPVTAVTTTEDPLADRNDSISGTVPTTDIDKDGIPWDARIHSDAKERKTKEGYWKRRRNVEDAVWDAVREELKAAMAAPAADVPPPPPAADVPPPPPAADVPPPPPAAVQYMIGDAGPFSREQLIASGYTDEAIDKLPHADVRPPQDFPTLLAMLAKPVSEGKITSERLDEAATSLGLPSWQTLIQRQDLVPAAYELIKAEI